MNALVLAGASNTGRLSEVASGDWEALIPVAGRPLLEYVLSSLQSASAVAGIFVAGPDGELAEVAGQFGAVRVEAGDSVIETLTRGVRAMPPADRILICTGDIPLLSPADIDGFIDLCLETGHDFFYPIIPRSLLESEFPGTRRTYVKLRDGQYTGGNMFVVNPAVIDSCTDQIRGFIDARKSPLRLASLLGTGFIFRLLTGTLTVAALEQKVSGLFGIEVRAVECPFAAIGIDVDKPADLELVAGVIERTQAGRDRSGRIQA